MDAKVIRAFCDKQSGRIYLEGEAFSADEERVAELAQGGFVEPQKPKRAPRKKAQPKE